MIKAILLSILLSNHSVSTSLSLIHLTVEYSEPLDVAYAATFAVTYNISNGSQTVINYVVIAPAGTTGVYTAGFRIPSGRTFDHYELVSYAEYYQ